MKLTAEIEADCRELVAIIDRQAAQSLLGMTPDASEVDDVAGRLIANGFPVSAFVREVMIRKFGRDPDERGGNA